MPTPDEIAAAVKRLGNRSEAGGRQPIEGFAVPALPEEFTRAFPKMKDWERDLATRFNEFVQKLNVVIPI